MPEIKLKHVISFSSEDKVHKAENLLNPETYRKWKCASPGEKNASIILQFEKATKIHSVDIGNENSAFVEVLVGRSSDSVNDYQVLLVASSFMSPSESKNGTHANRVRMFGPDKLSQTLKDEKWDCVQVLCTQPFNKNITYGLSFIKFHSPPEKNTENPSEAQSKTATAKLGAFNISYDDDEDNDSLPAIGSWVERKNKFVNSSLTKADKKEPSYASTVLSSADSPKNPSKRKHDDSETISSIPPAKKDSPSVRVNKERVGYKDILGTKTSNEETGSTSTNKKFGPKDLFGLNSTNNKSPTTSKKPTSKVLEASKALNTAKAKAKTPFHQLMKGVVFVISGFVNPLRSEIRDKALEMGAKYKGDWDSTCTHLVCAFVNTPKFIQVQNENGRIITKDWILDCHKKRAELPWRKYMLGRYAGNSSESSESEEEVIVTKPKAQKTLPARNRFESSESEEEEIITKPKAKKTVPSVNGSSKVENSPKTSILNASSEASISNAKSNKNIPAMKLDDSDETEDEEALQDYLADTDPNDSGGDTEDEIRKVENKAKQKDVIAQEKNDDDCLESDEDSSLLQAKPDTSNLPLPDLPNLFKSRHFYLYGDFSTVKEHDLKRYIAAYNGLLEEYMCDSVKYVISESKWDSNFEEALADNEDLIFVKPDWIFKCHEKSKLVPYQPFIIIPDS